MKTIVNIPDYLYEHLNEIIRGSMSSMLILDYVKQGTPLPKEHGRIVDENEITSFGWNYKANHASVNAPTIIEADKGEEEMTNGEEMDFPSTFDEFAEHYQIIDKDEHNSNGIELIPVFRVKQWLEHISTTKNDLEVDCISRAEVMQVLQEHWLNGTVAHRIIVEIGNDIQHLPSVTPQEPVIRDNGIKNELNRVKNELEPTTKNCIACKYDETEEEDGEHCKKCLAGDNQFKLDKEFVVPHCQCTDAEIAKSFIEDVEAVKDQL